MTTLIDRVVPPFKTFPPPDLDLEISSRCPGGDISPMSQDSQPCPDGPQVVTGLGRNGGGLPHERTGVAVGIQNEVEKEPDRLAHSAVVPGLRIHDQSLPEGRPPLLLSFSIVGTLCHMHEQLEKAPATSNSPQMKSKRAGDLLSGLAS